MSVRSCLEVNCTLQSNIAPVFFLQQLISISATGTYGPIIIRSQGGMFLAAGSDRKCQQAQCFRPFFIVAAETSKFRFGGLILTTSLIEGRQKTKRWRRQKVSSRGFLSSESFGSCYRDEANCPSGSRKTMSVCRFELRLRSNHPSMLPKKRIQCDFSLKFPTLVTTMRTRPISPAKCLVNGSRHEIGRAHV